MDYQGIYNRLVNRARSESRVKGKQIYYEAHHIVPKCKGGEGESSQWRHHSNIVLLTAKEHFVAHQLLCEIYPEHPGLLFALWAMCNQNTANSRVKVSSRVYSRLREESSTLKSELYKGQVGTWNGRIHSEKSKQMMREKKLGSKASDETKKKMSESRTGLKRTEEQKKAYSVAMTGIPKRKTECTFCKNLFSSSNILRHENACKSKII
jgi:hypothetical protein